jgi:hypothetical protein
MLVRVTLLVSTSNNGRAEILIGVQRTWELQLNWHAVLNKLKVSHNQLQEDKCVCEIHTASDNLSPFTQAKFTLVKLTSKVKCV